MTEHSVEQHLNVGASAYDAAIRTFVPHYDELLGTAVSLLKALAPKKAKILDLGGGTGALTEAVLAGLPEATAELLDIDPKMLEEAMKRLLSVSSRVKVTRGSFFDPLPQCDAVVASLSLHHIRGLAAKTKVYSSILGSLPPGGVFLNLDVTISGDPVLAELTYVRWAQGMRAHGISEPDARQLFRDWAEEDQYFALHEEFAAMLRAGFNEPECFWRRGSATIWGGRKAMEK